MDNARGHAAPVTTTPIRERASGILGRGIGAKMKPPQICGAIGCFDADRAQAIARLVSGARQIEIGELAGRARVWATEEPIRWGANGGPRGVAWSETLLDPPRPPRTRVEAARECSAIGLEIDGQSVGVHASGLGLAPLYVQREGQATYFCSRLTPLADTSPALLSIDWAAWSAIFEFGCPLGARTCFTEIERLEPGAWISHHGRSGEGVPGSDGWSWTEFGCEHRADPAGDILEAVRENVAAVPTRRNRAVVPLSGGWDSRLIAFLLAESGTKVETLTANSDAGHNVEEELAAPVAAGLGLGHRLVRTRNKDYWDDWRTAAELQEHQSPIHLPLQALARSIPRRQRPIFDGISGDVLIKSWWVDGRILGAPSWDRASRMLWRRFRLSKRGLRVFSEHHEYGVRDSARIQFMAEAQRFDGHEAAATLFISWARSRRSTAPCPLDLFGARGPVSLPFATDSVARAALSIAPHDKLGGELYKAVLDRADPRLARWPSTNDTSGPDQRHRRRRTLSSVAVEGYREMLRTHPLRPSFSGVFEQQVESGKIRHLLRYRQGLVALDALCRFGDWHARHSDSLKPFQSADLKQL